MGRQETLEALNELLTIHARSLPRYLTYARPWIHPGDEDALETLQLIVRDQQQMMERITETILDMEAQPDPGRFPLEFTATHDLSLDFLLRRAVEYQRTDVESIERCVEALRLVPAVLPLAQEALGLARGHLESLEALVTSKVE
jgi:hypothetical protein